MTGPDPIQTYLSELQRRLRGPTRATRRRFLAEAEAHLHETAASLERSGMTREQAARQAVARFGPARLVAGRLAQELAVRATWLASVVGLVGALAFVIPLYIIPENTLPPAPWPSDTLPGEYAWKHSAMLVAFAVAVVTGLLAAGAGALARWRGDASRRWPAMALAAMTASVLGLAVATALSGWLDAEWGSEVLGTPTGLLLGVALPLKLAITLGCGLAVVTAARRLHAVDPSAPEATTRT